jgi:hypothetical protein
VDYSSHLVRRVGGRLMFSDTERWGLYRLPIGLAQAQTEVLAFRVEMRPALATDTVCMEENTIEEHGGVRY